MLSRGHREIERVSCDLYSTRPGVSIASGTSYDTDHDSGMRRLRVDGQRLSCQLHPPSAGRFTIQADSNLATCVPRSLGAVVRVIARQR